MHNFFFFFLKPRNAQTKQNRKEDLHVQFSSIWMIKKMVFGFDKAHWIEIARVQSLFKAHTN